jgi:ParB-like chromosome segregation protein Spo0J
MSIKIAVGGAKRADIFGVDPFQVQMSEELRGRAKPPTEEDIIHLAESLLKEGQIEPVEVRRIDNEGHVALTLGFTRCAAARLIRTGFMGTDGELRQDEKFNLLVKVVDCNDQRAFERNIVENAIRQATSPVDDALNHDKLRTRYQYTDGDIAKLYGEKGTVRIGKLRKLLMLDQSVLNLVHEGNLAVERALDLLDLPPEQRAETVAVAVKEDGKVEGQVIREQVRAHHLSDDGKTVAAGTSSNGNGDGKVKSISLSMRELRTYFQEVVDGERYDTAEVRFAKEFLEFLAGKRTAKAMDNTLRRLLKSKQEK